MTESHHVVAARARYDRVYKNPDSSYWERYDAECDLNAHLFEDQFPDVWEEMYARWKRDNPMSDWYPDRTVVEASRSALAPPPLAPVRGGAS